MREIEKKLTIIMIITIALYFILGIMLFIVSHFIGNSLLYYFIGAMALTSIIIFAISFWIYILI